MCLSTVYREEKSEKNIIMKNVMRVECQGDQLILTDLMERKKILHASLKCADLTDAFLIIHEQ